MVGKAVVINLYETHAAVIDIEFIVLRHLAVGHLYHAFDKNFSGDAGIAPFPVGASMRKAQLAPHVSDDFAFVDCVARPDENMVATAMIGFDNIRWGQGFEGDVLRIITRPQGFDDMLRADLLFNLGLDRYFVRIGGKARVALVNFTPGDFFIKSLRIPEVRKLPELPEIPQFDGQFVRDQTDQKAYTTNSQLSDHMRLIIDFLGVFQGKFLTLG